MIVKNSIVIFLSFFFLSILGSGYSAADDVYIYMTYARAIFFESNSYSYNGVESAGATSFLWLVIAGFSQWLFGGGIYTWKILGAIFYGFSAVALASAFRLPSLLLLMLMMDPLTLRWSSTGMENSLTLLFISLLFSTLSYNKKYVKWMFFLLPFSFIVRPEIFLLNAMLCIYLATNKKDETVKFIIFFLAAAVIFIAGKLFIEFPLLPQTARAKAIFLKQYENTYAAVTLAKIFAVSAAVFVAVVILNFGKISKERKNLWMISLVYAIVISAYLSFSNSLVSTRYETSVFFPIVLASVLCISELSVKNIFSRLVYLQIIISIGLFLYFSPAKLSDEGDAIRDFAFEAKKIISGIDNRVVMSEVGAFGFYSKLPIIDVVGLVSPDARIFYEKTHRIPSKSLEEFLIFCNAKYYIDSFGGDSPIVGNKIVLKELLKRHVVRNNMSRGGLKPDVWRLYKIEREPQADLSQGQRNLGGAEPVLEATK